MNELIIKYKDSEGNVTDRRISEIAQEGPGAISAFCHLRQEKRTFNIKHILYAVNPDSGEIMDDLYKCFGLPSPDENKHLTSAIEPSLISKIPGHSSEAYKGQRNKEKYEIFKHFRHPAIADLFKNRLFALFDHQCYKCGQIADLDIDHHVPMVLGGHLVPGNLVTLCKRCNNRKRDLHPEEFYSQEELSRLKPILEKQFKVFNFEFDWNLWNTDPKEYLLFLGVDPILVSEMFTNPDHRYFVEPPSPDICITISVDISEILKSKP